MQPDGLMMATLWQKGGNTGVHASALDDGGEQLDVAQQVQEAQDGEPLSAQRHGAKVGACKRSGAAAQGPARARHALAALLKGEDLGDRQRRHEVAVQREGQVIDANVAALAAVRLPAGSCQLLSHPRHHRLGPHEGSHAPPFYRLPALTQSRS